MSIAEIGVQNLELLLDVTYKLLLDLMYVFKDTAVSLDYWFLQCALFHAHCWSPLALFMRGCTFAQLWSGY
jgi:hypothetical protein